MQNLCEEIEVNQILNAIVLLGRSVSEKIDAHILCVRIHTYMRQDICSPLSRQRIRSYEHPRRTMGWQLRTT